MVEIIFRYTDTVIRYGHPDHVGVGIVGGNIDMTPNVNGGHGVIDDIQKDLLQLSPVG